MIESQKAVNDLRELIEVHNVSYPILKKVFEIGNKPILLVGPVNCGKSHAVLQLCREQIINCYNSSVIETDDEFYGFYSSDGVFQKSPLFMAYVNGQVFYLDELLKCSSSILKKLLELSKSNSFNFPCGKIEKGKGFRIIISVDKKFIKKAKVFLNEFDIVNFDYDPKVEAHLCPNRELFYFIAGLRSISNIVNFSITTNTFEKLYKMKKIPSFTTLDIVRCALGGNYTKGVIEQTISNLETKLKDNKYFKELKTLVNAKS